MLLTDWCVLTVYLILYHSYLELAILPCWRFLLDQPADNLQRLVMMTRGLGDPVASAYCRLYMAHCAQKLPSHEIGILAYIIYWILILIMRINNTCEPDGSILIVKIRSVCIQRFFALAFAYVIVYHNELTP